jgi:3-oxoacyl-[acyl-carrier-protein] synthase III
VSADTPKINEGQPLSLVLNGEETVLFPDASGNTYITFGDGTAAVHVAPGDEWVYVEELS